MEKNIKMIRGDTLAFGLEFEGLTEDLDGASFTVKKNIDDVNASVQKTLEDGIDKIETGKYRVRVDPTDTVSLDPGYYVYDLEIEINDDVYTLLNGVLKLEKGVTE